MTESSATFQDEFLSELCEKAWITDHDTRAVLKAELLPVLQERIMLQIYSRLTPQQNEQLTALFVQGTSDEIQYFIRSAIDQYDAFLAEIYMQFEDEYLTLMRNQ
jgi:hypothetical protein